MTYKKLNLLVIDDSVGDAYVLRELLTIARPDGVQFTHCVDGESALPRLRAMPVDCVFLDYMLDGVSGLDVLRSIREAGYDVPVVALSGCGNERVAVEALHLGAQDYLVKEGLTHDTVNRAMTNAIEKVALQRQLNERQTALEHYARIAAHDLRGPLYSIVSFSEMLSTGAVDLSSDEAHTSLERIHSSARWMSNLVDSLLVYASAGSADSFTDNVVLEAIVCTAMTNLESQVNQTGARVRIDPLPVVQGDPVQLVQLVQNLVENALKFYSDEAPDVRISAERIDDRWRVAVSDQGIGVHESMRDEVFLPLRRLHTKESYGGTGIGLATCKRIVAHHGGHIWFESTEGIGTTFYFTLPSSDTEAPAPPSPGPTTPPTPSLQAAGEPQATFS